MDAVAGIADIIKNIGVLSRNRIIKVIGTATGVSATAMDGALDAGMIYSARANGGHSDELSNVVCYGELKQPIAELVDCTIGLKNFSIFEGFSTWHESRDAIVIKEGSPGNLKPVGLRFDYPSGALACYRFASESFTNSVVNVPRLNVNGAVFAVTSHPKAKGIKLFKHFAAEAAKSNKQNFWACMNTRGRLYFSFDDRKPSNDTVRFEFDGGLPFEKLAPYAYPAKSVLEVLSLASTSTSLSMAFSNSGCLKIEVDSGLGSYQFIFPGGEQLIWRWGMADDWPQVYHIDQMVRDDRCMQHDWEPDIN